MGGGLLGSPLQRGIVRDRNSRAADCLSEEYRSSWYISREEIENCSPSRKDGIDLKKESELRLWYCSFLKDIGTRLGVPQLTIATSIMFCHRFYLHQSHAKNEWQTIATVCMFLASKVEETPCSLDKVVKVAYETMYKNDPATARKIYQKDVFARQKALILIGEKVLLSTIRFDFNVQHPHRPLFDALKKLGITQEAVIQKAWKFVDDSLRTTLCLQYKPHYIAAGSVFLAAKLYNVRLPSERGYAWWNEFDVMPQQLNAAVQEMAELLGYKRRPPVARRIERPAEIPLAAKNEASSSPDSCVLSRPDSSRSTASQDFEGEAGRQGPVNCVVRDSGSNRGMDSERSCVSSRTEPQCQPRDSESPTGIVEDRQGSGKGVQQVRTNPEHVADGLRTIDVDRIKGMMKWQKREREANKRTEPMDDSIGDAWIERELESCIELVADSSKKLRLAQGYEVKIIG